MMRSGELAYIADVLKLVFIEPKARLCNRPGMCALVIFRKANELKTSVEVSPHMVQQFKDLWQRFADTPFKGLRDRLANSTYFLICGIGARHCVY